MDFVTLIDILFPHIGCQFSYKNQFISCICWHFSEKISVWEWLIRGFGTQQPESLNLLIEILDWRLHSSSLEQPKA